MLSALVIGSMTPDMHFLMPFHVGREETHSFAGLFWFCLPAGFFSYLAFHLLLKLPLFSLLPYDVAVRLAIFVRPSALLPKVPWVGVVFSIFVGALTHIAWDALTHGDTFGFRSLGFLRVLVLSPGGYPVYVCDLLQGASSVIGMGLLGHWSLNWLRSASPEALPIHLTNAGRKFMFASIVFSALVAMVSGVRPRSGSAFEILSKIVSSEMTAMLIPVLIYALAWHAMRLCKHSATDIG